MTAAPPPVTLPLLSVFDAWAARLSRAAVAGPSHRAAAVVVAVVAAIVALALVTAPAVFLNDTYFDLILPMDWANRMAEGQWPHRDFMTPVGTLYHLILWAGHSLSGGDTRLILWANTIVFVPVTILAWIATRDRLPALLRVIVVLYSALVVGSPRGYDEPMLRITHLAPYNRQAGALACVALLFLILPPRTPNNRGRALTEGILAGLVLFALFYIKVPMFALGVVGLGASVLFGLNRRAALVATILLVLAIAAASVLDPTFSGYLSDMAATGRSGLASTSPLTRLSRLPEVISVNLWTLVTIGFGSCWLLLNTPAGSPAKGTLTRHVIALLIVTAAAGAAATQNFGVGIAPNVALLALLFDIGRRWVDNRVSLGQPLSLPLLRVLALSAVPLVLISGLTMLTDLGSVAGQTLGARVGRPVLPVPAMQRAVMPVDPAIGTLGLLAKGEITPAAAQTLGFLGTEDDDRRWTGDGLALIDRYAPVASHPQERILTLGFAQMFSVLTETPSPRHIEAWWDWGRTFGPASPLDPALTLSDADVVLLPKLLRDTGPDRALIRMLRPALETTFHKAGASDIWEIWLKGR